MLVVDSDMPEVPTSVLTSGEETTKELFEMPTESAPDPAIDRDPAAIAPEDVELVVFPTA